MAGKIVGESESPVGTRNCSGGTSGRRGKAEGPGFEIFFPFLLSKFNFTTFHWPSFQLKLSSVFKIYLYLLEDKYVDWKKILTMPGKRETLSIPL